MPQKFNVKYVAEDSKKYTPIIIHRTIYGSIERFLGILIEHYAGRFPLWLAPIQVRILTVADRFTDYAEKIKEEFEKEEKTKTLAVRTLDNKVYFGVKLNDLIKNINENIMKKNERIEF